MCSSIARSNSSHVQKLKKRDQHHQSQITVVKRIMVAQVPCQITVVKLMFALSSVRKLHRSCRYVAMRDARYVRDLFFAYEDDIFKCVERATRCNASFAMSRSANKSHIVLARALRCVELRIVTEFSRVSGKVPEYVSRVNHVFFCSRRGSLRTMSTLYTRQVSSHVDNECA